MRDIRDHRPRADRRRDLDLHLRRHPAHRPREDRGDRIRPGGVRVRREDLQRHPRGRRAVARHRAGRRRLVRGAARAGRRRSPGQARSGRPGDDVRLRVPRDRRAHAPPDHPGAQDLQAAGRGASCGGAALPATGREGPGHRSLRGRRARTPASGRDRARSHLDAARRRNRLGVPHQAGPRRARAPADSARGTCTTRVASSTRTSSTSTPPGGSSSAGRWATPV